MHTENVNIEKNTNIELHSMLFQT